MHIVLFMIRSFKFSFHWPCMAPGTETDERGWISPPLQLVAMWIVNGKIALNS